MSSVTQKETKSKQKQRGKGEGSIYQTTNGLWTARIQIGVKENGKANVKAFYGKTKQEAKKKLDDYLYMYRRGEKEVAKSSGV